MSEQQPEEQNWGESRIVWLVENLDDIDYVRERRTDCPTRRAGPIAKGVVNPEFKLIGYSELKPKWPKEPGAAGFHRRVFALKPHDRCYGEGAKDLVYKTWAPISGVDPRTVKPNIAGRKTERSEGGKL